MRQAPSEMPVGSLGAPAQISVHIGPIFSLQVCPSWTALAKSEAKSSPQREQFAGVFGEHGVAVGMAVSVGTGVSVGGGVNVPGIGVDGVGGAVGTGVVFNETLSWFS